VGGNTFPSFHNLLGHSVKILNMDLTKVERLEIAILREKQYSMRSVGESMNRSPNTISYEIKVGSTNGVYDPHKAHIKAQVRKKYRRFQYAKIEKYPEIKEVIIEKLEAHKTSVFLPISVIHTALGRKEP
jgi:IS30 family transposase